MVLKKKPETENRHKITDITKSSDYINKNLNYIHKMDSMLVMHNITYLSDKGPSASRETSRRILKYISVVCL